MSTLRILPAQFSLLLVSALLMRLGLPLIMIVPLTLMLMLALLVPWSEVRTLMSMVLGVVSLMWVFMTWLRVQERLAYGEPWSRLAGILAAVALFSAWSAWLVWNSRKVDQRRSSARTMDPAGSDRSSV
jgi:type VI protein secretion system component VasK